MIDQNNLNRIIGDYLEVNSDIVSREFNSKLPKFVSKIISTKQRKKLLSSIEKFRKSEYILDWINLVELFTYIYNNFEPEHSYGIVTKVESTNNTLEALVQFDEYQALIYFDQLEISSANEAKFNLRMKKTSHDNSDGIDIYLSRLKGTARKSQEFVDELNYVLKECISNYITDVIMKYMEE